MEFNNEEHYTKCADDIKQSAELVIEKSYAECEQLPIRGDEEDVKYANTQDYLNIGQIPLSQRNREAPEMATTLGFIKEEHIGLDDTQILAHTVKIEVEQEACTFIKNEDQINAGPSIILKSEDVPVYGITVRDTKEESGSSELEVLKDQIPTGRMFLHRLPTDAVPPSTTSSGFIKEEHIDLDDTQILAHTVKIEVEQEACTFVKNEDQINAGSSIISKSEDVPVYGITASDIKEESRSSELEMSKDQLASRRMILHRLPTDTVLPSTSSSGGAIKMNIDMFYDNKTDNKLRKDALEEGTNKVDETIATYFILNQQTVTTNNKQKKNVKFDKCDLRSSRRNLLKHMRTHTGEKPHKNISCDYRSVQTSDLKKHKRIHTGEQPYKCEICDYKGTRPNHLKIHMRTHTGEKPYKCESCDFKAAQSNSLKIHMRTHTGEKPFKCGLCDYKGTRSNDLKIHMRTHTGEKPFKCETCDFSTAQKHCLKLHMRTHTGEKPYKCGTCEFKTAQSHCLKTHMRIHTGEKPFNCGICDFKSTQSSHLKIHLRTHTGEKPYKCETCDYECNRSSDLKIHIRTHAIEVPYKCETCNFGTYHSRSLKTHMRIHTDEKPYKCETCEFRTNYSSTLKRHMRTHTGEKPYKCDMCGYKSTQSGHLRTHMRTHASEEPYKCGACHYMSTRSSDLKIHMRTHAIEQPHKCGTCDYESTRSSNLKRHMQTHAGDK